MTTLAITSVVCITITSIISFACGKYKERAEWNKLIDKGILPKPSKKNR